MEPVGVEVLQTAWLLVLVGVRAVETVAQKDVVLVAYAELRLGRVGEVGKLVVGNG